MHQGYGLGPEWVTKSAFRSSLVDSIQNKSGRMKVHFQQEILAYSENSGRRWHWLTQNSSLQDDKDDLLRKAIKEQFIDFSLYPLHVLTSKGVILAGDFMISATGVLPNTDFVKSSGVELDEEGFIIVDDFLQSSIKNIYSAGDCCSYHPKVRDCKHFFQMKLWTQAKVMGLFAAQCMAGVQEDYGVDTHLELFAHVTRFFGFKVVLLGRYNAQGLGDFLENVVKTTVCVYDESSNSMETTKDRQTLNDGDDGDSTPSPCLYEVWVRAIPNKEYVKLVVQKGKVIGALLIGISEGLEEVFENLILNQIDVSNIGMALLDPDNDISDYFD